MKQKMKFALLILSIMALGGCSLKSNLLNIENAVDVVMFESYDEVEMAGESTENEIKEGMAEIKEAAPEEKEVLISLAGDCSLGKLTVHGYEKTFYEYYDKNGSEYFLNNVKSFFEQDDLTLVNFEGVLTTSNDIQEKQFNIKGEPEFKFILPEGSVEAVSFANNHRLDFGQQGVDDTIEAFEDVNVVYAYDSNLGIFETEDGIRIGIVSVDVLANGIGVEVFLKKGIGELKEKTDLIIACCHWGQESQHYPNWVQKDVGKMCIDLGADLVVGTHPHVLQGIDYYNGKYILYSLGNFCFGGNLNPKIKNTMIVQATARFDDMGLKEEIQLQVIPCTISSVEEWNDFCPTIAEGERRAQILEEVRGYSKEFAVGIAENGMVIPRPDEH